MQRVSTGRSEIDVTVRGDGETVLFIHGSVMGGTFEAMCARPPLAQGFRLIAYDRQGYSGSSHSPGPYSIADQAADALAVLREAGAGRAHVVGHSYGAITALQLALDASDAVQSLTLLEPPLLAAESSESFMAAVGPAVEAYSSGDKHAATDTFLRVVGGPDYRSMLDKVQPEGWFEQAVADADTLFSVEFPALEQWAFGPEEAGRIRQPVLLVKGEQTDAFFAGSCDLLEQWVPHAKVYTLPGANHMLQLANPADMAEKLASFVQAQGAQSR